mmetsp:Transcript_19116/g.26307  ORF Transcript_19116/g.26307 Transcript_19116/m.26307 type:complete len:86 (+) Transcript_19116:81-338(+)
MFDYIILMRTETCCNRTIGSDQCARLLFRFMFSFEVFYDACLGCRLVEEHIVVRPFGHVLPAGDWVFSSAHYFGLSFLPTWNLRT